MSSSSKLSLTERLHQSGLLPELDTHCRALPISSAADTTNDLVVANSTASLLAILDNDADGKQSVNKNRDGHLSPIAAEQYRVSRQDQSRIADFAESRNVTSERDERGTNWMGFGAGILAGLACGWGTVLLVTTAMVTASPQPTIASINFTGNVRLDAELLARAAADADRGAAVENAAAGSAGINLLLRAPNDTETATPRGTTKSVHSAQPVQWHGLQPTRSDEERLGAPAGDPAKARTAGLRIVPAVVTELDADGQQSAPRTSAMTYSSVAKSSRSSRVAVSKSNEVRTSAIKAAPANSTVVRRPVPALNASGTTDDSKAEPVPSTGLPPLPLLKRQAAVSGDLERQGAQQVGSGQPELSKTSLKRKAQRFRYQRGTRNLSKRGVPLRSGRRSGLLKARARSAPPIQYQNFGVPKRPAWARNAFRSTR